MSPNFEALKLHSAEFKHTVPPKFSEGGYAMPDEAFVRHGAYFFKDGNITFLIDGTLYCVHRYLFSRDSLYFSTQFAQLGVRDHEAFPSILSIGDVERKDFEALLSVLYPMNFEAHALTYDQWKSVLHLATRWDFASLRKLALKSIHLPPPHDQLVLARTYSVEHWVVPALTALCSRTLPLSLGEARQMSMEDVILVATVREEIRGGALQANIPHNIAKIKVEAQLAKIEAETKTKADAEAKANASTGAEAETREKHETEAKFDPKIAEEAKEKTTKETKAATALEATQKAEMEERRQRAQMRLTSARAAASAVSTLASSPMSPAWSGGLLRGTPAAASATIATEELTPPPKSTDRWAEFHASFPTRSPDSPGAPIQHPLTTCSPRGSASTQDKQLGKAGDSEGNQVTAALPADAAANVSNQAKCKTSVTTADKHLLSKTTDASKTCNMVGGTTASDAPSDKYFTPMTCNADFMRAQKIARAGAVVGPWPGKILDPSSALPPSAVTPCQPLAFPGSHTLQKPCQPNPVTGGFPLQMWPYPLPPSRIPPEEVSSMTKEHTLAPELVASASADKPKFELNVLDVKNGEEKPAQTKASPAWVQDSGVKSNWATTEPMPWWSKYASEAGSWGSDVTKGGGTNPKGSVKSTHRLDHLREIGTSSTMSASDPEVPANTTLSSSLEEGDDEASGVQSEKARKQAERYEKNSLRPSSGATSVDHPVLQEHKPIDISGGEGEGVGVDAKTESGKDDTLVIVEEPDTATATAGTDPARYDDELVWW